MKNQSTRRALLARGLELVGLIVLLVVASILYSRATETRSQAGQAKQRAEQLPVTQSNIDIAVQDFAAREDDLDEVRDLLLTRDTISAFVTELEQTAQSAGVEVRVTEVLELVQHDSKGEVTPWTGPVREVSFQFTVSGEPLNNLRWLYDAEHLPLLIRTEEWRLTGEQAAPATFARPASNPAGDKLVEPAATLRGTFILTIANDVPAE